MLTGPDHKDIDFSVPDIEFENAAAVPKSHGFWLALFASLALHLLLVFIPLESSPPAQVTAPRTVHVTLFQAPQSNEIPGVETFHAMDQQSLPAINDMEIQPQEASDKAVKEAVNDTATTLSAVVGAENISDESAPHARRYQPLSSQDLSEISAGQNGGRDYQNSSGAGRNVFHPGLREQLNSLEQQTAMARAEDSQLNIYSTGIGSDRLKTKGGGCFTASDNGRDSGPRNWYMIRCGGKPDSENIMERVNQSVSERFNRQ